MECSPESAFMVPKSRAFIHPVLPKTLCFEAVLNGKRSQLDGTGKDGFLGATGGNDPLVPESAFWKVSILLPE